MNTNKFLNLREKIEALPNDRINWKIIVLYLVVIVVHLFIFILTFVLQNPGDTTLLGSMQSEQLQRVVYPLQSPISHLLHVTIWPVVVGLLFIFFGWLLAIKFLGIPKKTISAYKLINLYFFSKLTAWIIGVPFLILGYIMPMLIRSLSFSTFTIINFRIVMPLYSWVLSLVFSTLMVVGIVLSVQRSKAADLTIEK